MKCPICSSSQTTKLFSVSREEVDKYAQCDRGKNDKVQPAQYAECRNCAAMYLMADDRYDRIYDGFAYTVETGDAADFIARRFKVVTELPPEKSDNVQRVARIRETVAQQTTGLSHTPRQVLDIGAGMGVFLHAFLDENWIGTAIEPDPAACAHLRQVLPQTTVHQGYHNEINVLEEFDLITMNRMLEHVSSPVATLATAVRMLKPGGLMYLELPDVRAYYRNGPDDLDFGYGHYVIFSPQALLSAGLQAGLDVCHMERVREPSGKFTIFGLFERIGEDTVL